LYYYIELSESMILALRLLNLKCKHNFTDNAFTDILDLIGGDSDKRSIPIRNLYTEMIRFVYVLYTFLQIPYHNSVYFIMNYFL